MSEWMREGGCCEGGREEGGRRRGREEVGEVETEFWVVVQCE